MRVVVTIFFISASTTLTAQDISKYQIQHKYAMKHKGVLYDNGMINQELQKQRFHEIQINETMKNYYAAQSKKKKWVAVPTPRRNRFRLNRYRKPKHR